MVWYNVKDTKGLSRIPENTKLLLATVYIKDGKFKRDYAVGTYNKKNNTWNGICDEDVVTHFSYVEEVEGEPDVY